MAKRKRFVLVHALNRAGVDTVRALPVKCITSITYEFDGKHWHWQARWDEGWGYLSPKEANQVLGKGAAWSIRWVNRGRYERSNSPDLRVVK